MKKYIVENYELSLLPEGKGYRGSNHTADQSAYEAVQAEDKFIVDYMRVFDEVSE